MNLQTSDAQDLDIDNRGDELFIKFVDWAGKKRTVHFKKLLGYRFGPFFDNVPAHTATYKISESSFIQQYEFSLKSYMEERFTTPFQFKHYKLCFHKLGVAIDIIAETIEIQDS